MAINRNNPKQEPILRAGIRLETLPEGYEFVMLTIGGEGGVALARKAGMWAVWTIIENELRSGHFYCERCPGAEDLARAEYEARITCR